MSKLDDEFQSWKTLSFDRWQWDQRALRQRWDKIKALEKEIDTLKQELKELYAGLAEITQTILGVNVGQRAE